MSKPLPTSLTLPVIFGVALATGFSGAVVPGSLLAVVVEESVRVGWLAGPLMMIGHGALELIAVVLLATGLIRFAQSGRVRGAIGLLGGAVLLYLGYLTFGVSGEVGASALGGHAAGTRLPSAAAIPALQGVVRLAALGGLMSMTNPYWWLWWATIGVAHVGWATHRGRLGGGTYFVGHILSDILWYCAVAAALSAGRALFSAGVLRGIYVGCAVFLVALGGVFLVAGGRTLTSSRHR
jgi:threonine/homoserine/homoserine lactone efflux protein